jgi:large subunit ribosomal protein L19
MNIMEAVTQDCLRDDMPEIKIGDTVKVHIRIVEGSRERIQVFEGFVLKKQNGGIAETFTVRRIASGVGVEKTFPINSPKIDKVEVVKHGFVRRGKLTYMRQRTGKSARIRSKEIR